MMNRLPSIPTYFKEYVDSKVDLSIYSSVACPFHMEEHGRSFSYKESDGIWRCFGACHTGGDVVDLHRHNFKIKTREEALKSLCSLYKIHYDTSIPKRIKPVTPDIDKVQRNRAYAAAIRLAKTVEDYLELDYIMSKVPFDLQEVTDFCSSRGFELTVINMEELQDACC